PVRSEKTLLVVAEDRMRAALLQHAHDVVREPVFPDAVAEADQLVDVADQAQRLCQPRNVAVQVRDDADLQEPPPVPSPPSGEGLGWGPRRRMMFIGLMLITASPSWFSAST